MPKLSVILLVMTLVVGTYASCPSVTYMQNFDANRFTGVWYEIQAQPNSLNPVKTCNKSVYNLMSSGFSVTTTGLMYGGIPTQSSVTLTFTANPAKMITSRVMGVRPPYEVLDTDYNTYACTHSCIHKVFTYDYVFIFSRGRTLNQAHIDHCRSLFAQYQSSSQNLHRLVNTRQEGCPN
ncbi:unnamed protein product [Meganyctiphanes norvegica]|uniref:Lipocalin/cytosolic fatty-acid binding domain-containing protein n=1 Tax=Meganyctiphanes norvegica TaxID=48144 RepID=A0AAV2RLF5_MEGNR